MKEKKTSIEIHRYRKSQIFLLLSIAIMIIIFWFSAQVADDSESMSTGFLDLLLSGKIPVLSQIAIYSHIFDIFPIRKCAHAFIYFLLGCSWSSWAGCRIDEPVSDRLQDFLRIPFGRILIPWCFCILYACSDEFHQLFVEGRSCQIQDVGIDSTGALVGIILILLLLLLLHRRKGINREDLADTFQ